MGDHISWTFEPGHSPVVALSKDGEPAAAVGVRPQIARLELRGDHAIHFDGAGRIITVQKDGVIYRRTLDSRLLVTKVVRGGGRRPRPREERQKGWIRLPAPTDPLAFLAEEHAHAREVLKWAAAGERCEVLEGEVDDPASWLRRQLERAATFDEAALRADAEALLRLYLPIPILPPDQYGSLVLQLSEGCAWNRCRFCDFYRNIPYRERSTEEVIAHADAVMAHLGGTLSRMHRVFLGQANALLVDNEKLLPSLRAIAGRLALLPRGLRGAEKERFQEEHELWIDGFYSFIDAFHRRKSPSEYEDLARVGVRRVYLGLESGSPQVLELLGKPPVVDEAVELVHHLRRAGISTGVIVLVGAGGRRVAPKHQEETLEVLKRMELVQGDQLYLSRLVIHEGGEYDQRAREEGLEPLSPIEQDHQIAALREGVRAGSHARFPVASYDITLSRSIAPLGKG